MAARLLNTFLYLLLFLLAFLLIIRMIRSKEGFQNEEKPKEEQYDLDLFFKEFPIQRVCEIYENGFPTIVNSFSIDEKGEKISEEIARTSATEYLKKTLAGGLVPCPFSLPKNKLLKTSFDFVEKLDDNLLIMAFSTLLFFVGNTQQTADTSNKQMKKLKEGFISECSAEEIENKEYVPLQCIPADIMKATEQQEINAVDRKIMEQRVYMKSAIAKKLGRMKEKLVAFQKTVANVNKKDIEYYKEKVQGAKKEYDWFTSYIDNKIYEKPMAAYSEERANRKKMAWKADLDDYTSKLDLAVIYFKFAFIPVDKLVEKYDKLRKEIEGAANEIESGIPGAPKS
jgi:hypothetical protein